MRISLATQDCRRRTGWQGIAYSASASAPPAFQGRRVHAARNILPETARRARERERMEWDFESARGKFDIVLSILAGRCLGSAAAY
jgi:hypothetical protein